MRRILLLLLLSLPATVLAGPYFVGPYFDATPTTGAGGGPLPPNVVFGTGTPFHMTVWGPGPNDIQDSVIVIDVVNGDMSSVRNIELVSVSSLPATDITMNPGRGVTINLGAGSADDFVVDPTTCTLIAEGGSGRVGINRCDPQLQLHVGIGTAPPAMALITASTIARFDNAGATGTNAYIEVASFGEPYSAGLLMRDKDDGSFGLLSFSDEGIVAGEPTVLLSVAGGGFTMQTGSTTALETHGLRIGASLAKVAHGSLLDVVGTDGGVTVPRVTTAQRDAFTAAPGSVQDGTVIYNNFPAPTDFEFRVNGAWIRYATTAGSGNVGPGTLNHVAIFGPGVNDVKDSPIIIDPVNADISGLTTLTAVDGIDVNIGAGPGDDFDVDGCSLLVEGDNERVGINRCAPQARLHVGNGTETALPIISAQVVALFEDVTPGGFATVRVMSDALGIPTYELGDDAGKSVYMQMNPSLNVFDISMLPQAGAEKIDIVLNGGAGDDFRVRTPLSATNTTGLVVTGDSSRLGLRTLTPRGPIDACVDGACSTAIAPADFVFEDSLLATSSAVMSIFSGASSTDGGILFSYAADIAHGQILFDHTAVSGAGRMLLTASGGIANAVQIDGTSNLRARTFMSQDDLDLEVVLGGGPGDDFIVRNATNNVLTAATDTENVGIRTLNPRGTFDVCSSGACTLAATTSVIIENSSVATSAASLTLVSGVSAAESKLVFADTAAVQEGFIYYSHAVPERMVVGTENSPIMTVTEEGLAVEVATSNPVPDAVLLNLSSATSVLQVPRLTKTALATIVTNGDATQGMVAYSTTDSCFVEYHTTAGAFVCSGDPDGDHVSGPTPATTVANRVALWTNTLGRDIKNSTLQYNLSVFHGPPINDFRDTLSTPTPATFAVQAKDFISPSPITFSILSPNAPGDDFTIQSGLGVLFRVQGDTGDTTITESLDVAATTLYVNADDSRVGVGTAVPEVPLHVLTSGSPLPAKSGTALSVQSTATAGSAAHITLMSGNVAEASIFFADTDATTPGRIDYNHGADIMLFGTASNIGQMYIEADGDMHITSGTPSPTAGLELTSTTRGFLTSRVTTAERDAIGGGNCDTGLMVYNTTLGFMQSCQADDSWRSFGKGSIEGPVSSTVNAVPRFSNTTGDVLLNSGVTIDSSNRVVIPGNLLVGAGTLDVSTILELDSTTGAFLPPRMTNTQRDALTPTAGMVIYSSTNGCTQEYNGSVWGCIRGGGGTGAGKAAFGRLYLNNTAPSAQTVDTTPDATLFDWVAGVMDANSCVTATGTPPDLQLTVGTGCGGTYQIQASFDAPLTTQVAGDYYLLQLFNNGAAIGVDAQTVKMDPATDSHTVVINTIKALAAGDDIDMRLSVNVGTETADISAATITITRIQE